MAKLSQKEAPLNYSTSPFTLLHSWTKSLDFDILFCRLAATGEDGLFTPEEYIKNAKMVDVISLYNESIFYHLEQDLNSSEHLIAALDNAISIVDLQPSTATAYAGLPAESGYRESVGTEARFHTVISFCQISKDSIVVVDQRNYCLRMIDRQTGATSTLVGRCQRRKQPDEQQKTAMDELRMINPGVVVFDNASLSLFVADTTIVYRVDLASNTVHTHTTSPRTLASMILVKETDYVIAVMDHTVMRLYAGELNLAPVSIVGNVARSGDEHGTLNATLLSQPKGIVEFHPNVYLIADHHNNRVKMLNTNR